MVWHNYLNGGERTCWDGPHDGLCSWGGDWSATASQHDNRQRWHRDVANGGILLTVMAVCSGGTEIVRPASTTLGACKSGGTIEVIRNDARGAVRPWQV